MAALNLYGPPTGNGLPALSLPSQGMTLTPDTVRLRKTRFVLSVGSKFSPSRLMTISEMPPTLPV